METVTSAEDAPMPALGDQTTVTGGQGVQVGDKSVQINVHLSLQDANGPQAAVIADLLAERLYGQHMIERSLLQAGLDPRDYHLDYPAQLLWREVVRHAAGKGKLEALMRQVLVTDPALSGELGRRLDSGVWYECRDPYYCCFFGPGSKTAMIDRDGLRRGLADLLKDEYRVLVVCGARGSGKTHTWRLIDHLCRPGMPLAGQRCIRVSTHSWGAGTKVTSEMVAQEITDLLDLNIRITGSSELPQARTRKILTSLTARYPADGVLRWIVLDGLDRDEAIDPDDAKDVALPLITKVADGELPDTRLVITGFNELWLQGRRALLVETIPQISAELVRAFLADASGHLGRQPDSGELDAFTAEVLAVPPGAFPGRANGATPQPGLADVEDAVVRLVKREWGPGGQHAD